MPEPNKGLAERVEVFTRSASDALQKAVGDVLDARSPWQLLYRLLRIVLLGLVLYSGWLLFTLQPDLARRLSRPPDHSLTERVEQHKAQIQSLLPPDHWRSTRVCSPSSLPSRAVRSRLRG